MPALFIVISHLILLPFSIYHPVSSFSYGCHPPTTPPAAHNICSHLLFQAPIGLALLLSCLIIINEQHSVLSALIYSLVSPIMPDAGKPATSTAMQAINWIASSFHVIISY